MVTLLKNDFTGQSAGAATVANSGDSGDAFSHLVASGGTTFVYTNVSGNMVLDVGAGSGQGYPRWTTTGTDGRRAVLRRSFTTAGAPSAARTLLDIRTEADETAALASIHIRSGVHQLQARVGNSTDITESRWDLPGAGTYWIELAVTVSSETGEPDASVEYAIFNTSNELLHLWTSEATLTTSASPPNIARFSGNTSSTGVTPDRMDGLQALFTDNLTSWLGPYADTRVLPTPDVTIVEQVRPTQPGEPDGHITATWPKLADVGIGSYEVSVAPGHNATSGFVVKQIIAQPSSGSTVTGTAWGLHSGTHTVAVRSLPI